MCSGGRRAEDEERGPVRWGEGLGQLWGLHMALKNTGRVFPALGPSYTAGWLSQVGIPHVCPGPVCQPPDSLIPSLPTTAQSRLLAAGLRLPPGELLPAAGLAELCLPFLQRHWPPRLLNHTKGPWDQLPAWPNSCPLASGEAGTAFLSNSNEIFRLFQAPLDAGSAFYPLSPALGSGSVITPHTSSQAGPAQLTGRLLCTITSQRLQQGLWWGFSSSGSCASLACAHTVAPQHTHSGRPSQAPVLSESHSLLLASLIF